MLTNICPYIPILVQIRVPCHFFNGKQCLHRRQGIVLKNKIGKVTKDKNNMVSIHVYRNDKVGSRARHTGED